MISGRSTTQDGLHNQLEFYALTHFSGLWELVEQVGWLRRAANRFLINRAIYKTACRPYALSTLGGYTSWESLTDRTYDGRHLPPDEDQESGRPHPEEAMELFRRTGEAVLCPKSTVLFAYFAQWFTDGFLHSDRREPRKLGRNLSTHDIDLCQLYGLNRDVTERLRAHRDGLLKSQMLNGEEYPPYLCENGEIKLEFQGPELRGIEVLRFEQLDRDRRDQLFAVGSDRANTQIGYLMMNVLFLREHNRIARELLERYRLWDDERLFQTARNILIVLLVRVVVEEYINHIAPYHFQFFVDPSAFPNERWHRQNWMTTEFNLLYRWHSLIPSTLRMGGQEVSLGETIFTTDPLVEHGLGALFEDATQQRAGRVGLFNTPNELLRETDYPSITQGRALQLASYNDYRECCQFPRATAFDQISGDARTQSELSRLYSSVDRLDFYVGLFAEELRPNSALPALIGRLVGIDAFSQAFTNPLLAPMIYHERTFSPYGMELIESTNSLSTLLHRNLPPGSREYAASMTREGWQQV